MRQTVNHQSSLLLLSLIGFGLAVFAMALTLVDLRGTADMTIILPGVVFVGLLILMLVVGKRALSSNMPDRLDWLHPPVLITLWVIIMFGLPCLYGLMNPDILAPLTAIITFDPVFTIRGLLLILLGSACLWIGYGLGIHFWKPLPLVRRLSGTKPIPSMVVVFYILAIAAQILQIAVTGVAYGAESSRWGVLAPFQQWFGYMQDVYLLILAIVALQVLRREWNPSYLIGVLAIQAAFGFISGFMKPILWLSEITLISALIARADLRRLILPFVVLVVLSIAVVPVAENLRYQKDSGAYQSSDVTQVVDSTTQALADTVALGPKASWLLFVDRTLYRQATVSFTPGVIIERTPSIIPYRGIEQFLAIPAYLIPRALWRDKPALSLGNWFAITYLNQPSFVASSAAITVFGEGYMIAGWLGCVLACLILGTLLAFLYHNTAGVGLWPVYLALLPTFIDIEGQFTGLFVALVQRFVVFVVVYWLIVKFQPAQTTES